MITKDMDARFWAMFWPLVSSIRHGINQGPNEASKSLKSKCAFQKANVLFKKATVLFDTFMERTISRLQISKQKWIL